MSLNFLSTKVLTSQVLVLDTEKMTAYVEDENGVTLRNALPYLEEIEFPKLSVGSNAITITSNNAVFIELEIKARSRWR